MNGVHLQMASTYHGGNDDVPWDFGAPYVQTSPANCRFWRESVCWNLLEISLLFWTDQHQELPKMAIYFKGVQFRGALSTPISPIPPMYSNVTFLIQPPTSWSSLHVAQEAPTLRARVLPAWFLGPWAQRCLISCRMKKITVEEAAWDSREMDSR